MANLPTYKICIKSNATITESAEKFAPEGSFATGSQEWAVNPADAGAWEWADIDALQIGVSLKSDHSSVQGSCTQVYVEVDYTPAPVGTNMQVNISDVLKDIDEIKINISDVLKDVTEAKINIGGVLKDIF